MLRQVTCLPPPCTSMDVRVNAKRDSEKYGDYWKVEPVRGDGCKTSPEALQSHEYSHRGGGVGVSEAPMLHTVHAHTHTHTCRWQSTHNKPHVCIEAGVPTCTCSQAFKLYTSSWAALQSAGLMKGHCILQ